VEKTSAEFGIVGITILSTDDNTETEEGLESWSSDSSISSLDPRDTVCEPEPEPLTEPINKLKECFSDIAHVITCLYDFSIAIQNPAPKDRIQKCASIEVCHFEEWDIMVRKYFGYSA
jgi:hypothetical protein